MKSHFDAAEIAAMLGVGLRAIQQRASRECWTCEISRQGNGRKKRFVSADLPVDVREALNNWSFGELQSNETAPAPIYNDRRPAPATRGTGGELMVPLGPGRVEKWDPKRRDRAIKRLATVERARVFGRDRRAKELLAKEARTSYHTLQRWVRAADQALEAARAAGLDLTEAQLAALGDHHGWRKGQTEAFDEEAVRWAVRAYLHPNRLLLSYIHDDLRAEAELQGWRIGSLDTLRRIVAARVPEGARVMGRQGPRRYEARCVVKRKMRYDDLPPGFIYVGDHRIFDVFIQGPGGRPARPWITAWMDLRTRAFVGWHISFSPNSQTIALALRHAILPKSNPDLPMHGLPACVLIDNGKDYRAHGLKGELIDLGKIDYPEVMEQFQGLGIEPQYQDLEYDPADAVWKVKRGKRELVVKGVRVGGVFSRLGISARYATAYHPWAKAIERAFKESALGFDRRLPGWCGANPQEKPEGLAFMLKNPARNLLTLEQFKAAWEAWLVGRYHDRPHHGQGMEGLSPRRVWENLAEPKTIKTINPLLLDFALLKQEGVKVQSHGFRLRGGQEYELWHQDQNELAHLLNLLIGQRVNVYFDPGEPETCHVYFQGRFACLGRTLRRGSWVSDEGMEEHARKASAQRQAARAVLAAMGQEGRAPAATPFMGAAELVTISSKGGELEEPKSKERPALPQPGTEPEGAAEAGPGDGITDRRPALFASAEERFRWCLTRELLGRELSSDDAEFLRDYPEGQPVVSAGIRDEIEFLISQRPQQAKGVMS